MNASITTPRIRIVVESIVQHEGVGGLWRGTLPTIIRNVPGTGLYFLTLSEFRKYLLKNSVERNTANLLAGAVARITIGFAMMPVTVVKARFESDLYRYTGVGNAISDMVKKEGIHSLFRGFGPTMLRDGPFAGIYLLFYENFKRLSTRYTHISNEIAANMVSATSAGVMATLITQPFDMVKTRMQLKPQEYPFLVSSVRQIAASEGITAFFSGMMPRVARKSLSSALAWTIFEEAVRRMNK